MMKNDRIWNDMSSIGVTMSPRLTPPGTGALCLRLLLMMAALAETSEVLETSEVWVLPQRRWHKVDLRKAGVLAHVVDFQDKFLTQLRGAGNLDLGFLGGVGLAATLQLTRQFAFGVAP